MGRKKPTVIFWNPNFLRAVAKQLPAVCVSCCLEKYKDCEESRCHGGLLCGLPFYDMERPVFLGRGEEQRKCNYPEKQNRKGLTSEPQ